jgi:hypothetical protein
MAVLATMKSGRDVVITLPFMIPLDSTFLRLGSL